MSTLTQGMHETIEAFIVDRQAQNLAKSTIVFYREKLQYFVDFCKTQSIVSVSQITPNNLRMFFLGLQENHCEGGVLNIYAAIRAFLRWVESEEIMDDGWKNPIAKVRTPRVPVEVLEPISLENVQKLISVSNKRDACIFYILTDCGCRSSELLAMDVNDVDVISGEIIVRKSKTRRPRTIFIGTKTRKAVRAYLKTRKDDNPALFVTNIGERLQYFGLREILIRRCKKAHIDPPATLHQFRRCFALAMLRSSVDIFSIQKMGGWSSLSVLTRYLKQTTEDVKQVHRLHSPVDNGL